MNKRSILLILLAFIMAVNVAWAAPTVYVNNVKMYGVVVRNEQVYVPMDNFLTRGNYYWNQVGNTLEITNAMGTRSPIGTADQPARFSFKGSFFYPSVMVIQGRIYATAEDMANGVNMKSRYTESSDTYDFYNTNQAPPSREITEEKEGDPGMKPITKDTATTPHADIKEGEPAAKETKEASAGEQKVQYKGKDIKNSVIKPKNTYFFEWRTGEVRGEVTYQNTYKEPIRQISVEFRIIDGDGKVLWNTKHDVGELKANKMSKKFTYYWLNPGKYDISDSSFDYIVTYMQPESLAEKEGSKKETTKKETREEDEPEADSETEIKKRIGL